MASHKLGAALALLALCSLATCHAFSLKDLSTMLGQKSGSETPKTWQEYQAEKLDPKLGRPVWWNETVMDVTAEEHVVRRSTLGLGEAAPVTVTFYSTPGMDCETGNGQCGYGSDTNGDNDFVKNSLYPLHVAAGNMAFLGGCGACGILTGPTGLARGYVVTDVTEEEDSLGPRDWPPYGSHIDMCCHQFNEFQSLDHGNGVDCNHGGIFTGHWQRVPCQSLGYPDYPDNNVVVRIQAWNQWAKAVVPSRLNGVGEVSQVNFITERSGFHPGFRVDGWGAWWSPNADLSGHGGVALEIILKDGTRVNFNKGPNPFPLADFSDWKTGQLYNYNGNAS